MRDATLLTPASSSAPRILNSSAGIAVLDDRDGHTNGDRQEASSIHRCQCPGDGKRCERHHGALLIADRLAVGGHARLAERLNVTTSLWHGQETVPQRRCRVARSGDRATTARASGSLFPHNLASKAEESVPSAASLGDAQPPHFALDGTWVRLSYGVSRPGRCRCTRHAAGGGAEVTPCGKASSRRSAAKRNPRGSCTSPGATGTMHGGSGFCVSPGLCCELRKAARAFDDGISTQPPHLTSDGSEMSPAVRA